MIDTGRPIQGLASVQRSFNPFAALMEAATPPVPGALSGLPVSVKDILDVAGVPTRWGSRLMEDAPPARADIGAVARLRAAGAAIVAKTTTTEFAHSPLGYSPATGMTLNPWNVGRTCGGSSCGAGVAVATGATPLALATDAGCSVRLPAALTGVFGLKPTIGRIPHERLPDGFGAIVHLGLITASADLMCRALAVVAGEHPDDPLSLRQPVPSLASGAGGVAGRRIALWRRVGNESVDDDVAAQIEEAVRRLTRLGATVEPLDFALDNPDPCWEMIQRVSWAGRLAALDDDARALLSPTLLRGAAAGRAASALDLNDALGRRTRYFRGVQAVFGAGFDLILTPCAAAGAVAADHAVDAPLEMGGRPVGSLRRAWIPYLSLFDLSGHPALSLPCGFDREGVPMGVQLVAPWWRERGLLAAAQAWEVAYPPPVPSPGNDRFH